jgi:hypothetical protein
MERLKIVDELSFFKKKKKKKKKKKIKAQELPQKRSTNTKADNRQR